MMKIVELQQQIKLLAESDDVVIISSDDDDIDMNYGGGADGTDIWTPR